MNDRTVLIAAGVLAAVLVSFGALWSLRDYASPVFVDGDRVARDIDIRVGDLIAARFDAPVGAARCPKLIDFTGHRRARCAIPIAGDDLAIDVDMFPGHRELDLSTVDGLFVRRYGERAIADKLEQRYGEPFAVQCRGAAVRVIHRPDSVSCEIDAPDFSRRELPVASYGYGGALAVAEIPGAASREARILGAAVADQREGSVTVAGRLLERYVRGSAALMDHGEVGRRKLLGASRCPPRVVLHEGTHARCSVAVADVTVTYDVHFEKGAGLLTEPSTSVAVIAPLRDVATRYFRRRGFSAGTPAHLEQFGINCGTVPVIAFEPGSSLRCFADLAPEKFYFTFRFTDADGSFTIEPSVSD